MARAGYDPRALPFWERMQAQAGGNHPPAFFSDHPADAQRIADLKKLLPEAQEGRCWKPTRGCP